MQGCKPFPFHYTYSIYTRFLVACTNNMSTDQSTDIVGNTKRIDNREKVELTISAAASLKDAMEVIQRSYQEKHPRSGVNF